MFPGMFCLDLSRHLSSNNKRAFLINDRLKLLRANGYRTHEPAANDQNPRLILQRGTGLRIIVGVA
jgi:hypothetical protein